MTDADSAAQGPVLLCRNCNGVTPHTYCPHCGQKMRLKPPTLRDFLGEFALQNLHIEGKFWRTLKVLCLSPGGLTLDYVAGRRERYMSPLKLFFTSIFVYVLLSGMSAGRTQIDESNNAGALKAPATSKPTKNHCKIDDTFCLRVNAWAAHVVQRLEGDDARAVIGQAVERLGKLLPFGSFAMVPLFAGLVGLVYRSRKRTYGEHFVFGLHLHSFAFLISLPGAWLPWIYSLPIFIGFNGYAVVAMHRVYGGRKWATALRALCLGSIYELLLAVSVFGLMLYLVLS